VQFSGDAIYLEGQQPTTDEIRDRVDACWRPYHEALAAELARIRETHDRVVLWEGHSIRGECPFLFEGRLPDFNLGTSDGRSCSPVLQDRLTSVLDAQQGHDFVVNGRFKGGYITRHYGDPARGIDAVQLEISQRIYMDEATFAWDAARATRTQAVLQALLQVV